MESDQGSLKVSPLRTNFKQRPPPNWVPFPGSKRKAHVANLGDNFDVDCRPSPAKQFAVDEEVAADILRGGLYYDPLQPKSPLAPVNENPSSEDEVEMGEAPLISGVYPKAPGDTTDIPCARSAPACTSMSKTTEVGDEKECHDDSVIGPHSMHVSQPDLSSKLLSSNSQSLVMNAFSIILSNEIQETLTRGKRSEDFILPKSIINQVRSAKPMMALVPWKPQPRPENLIIYPSIKSPEILSQEKILCYQQNLSSVAPPRTLSTVPLLSVSKMSEQSHESLLLKSITHDEDNMDVDI